MATSTKQEKKAGREKLPVLGLKEAEKVMADNKAGYDAYEQARLALKAEGVSKADRTKHEKAMAENHEAFSAYWRQYNNPAVAAKRKKAREERQVAAEAEAKAKAARKAEKEKQAAAAEKEAQGGQA